MSGLLAPMAALAGGIVMQIVVLWCTTGDPEPFTADDRKALLEAFYSPPADLTARRGPLGQTEEETRRIAATDVDTHDEGPVITEMVMRCRAYVDAWDGKPVIRQMTEPEIEAKTKRKAAEALGLDKLQTTCRDEHIMQWGSQQCVICGRVDGRCLDCGQDAPGRVDRDRRIRKYQDSGHWPAAWCPTCVGIVPQQAPEPSTPVLSLLQRHGWGSDATDGSRADIPIPIRSDPALLSQVNAAPREVRNFAGRREVVPAPAKTYIPFGTTRIQLYDNMKAAMQHAREYRDEVMRADRERLNNNVQPVIVIPTAVTTEIESGTGLYGSTSCLCRHCGDTYYDHGDSVCRPPNTGPGSKR